jgi:hypothetical protein
MNEKIFSLLLCLLAVIAILFLPGAPLAAAEIMTLKLMYAALLLVLVFGLVHVFRGTKWDFYKEIIYQHNVAGAIFLSAIIIGLAVVIGK